MVRDMNVGTRVAAFTALGRIAFVSQDILSQTLSKRVLGAIKEKSSLALSSSKFHVIHAAVAAGAFIHGLEDEYNEVKQNLAALSGYFEVVLLLTGSSLHIFTLHTMIWF